ncbi:MAG: Mth938-like domain-containing protein [Alphaproteobacteria bacterium]
MDVTPLIPAERQLIQAYGEGRFRIANAVYEGSVIVLPEHTLAWPVRALAEVTIESLAAVLSAEPKVELLLLGCGSAMAPLKRELRVAMRARGVVVEAMDTGAACRTFNVLLSEERRAAAALIALG